MVDRPKRPTGNELNWWDRADLSEEDLLREQGRLLERIDSRLHNINTIVSIVFAVSALGFIILIVFGGA